MPTIKPSTDPLATPEVAVPAPSVKAKTSPKPEVVAATDSTNVLIGLKGDGKPCSVSHEMWYQMSYRTANLVNGVPVLPNGQPLLEAVFEAYGLARYVEKAKEGKCKLAVIDGNPLNCTVENITVNSL